jgi:hypothetical protein
VSPSLALAIPQKEERMWKAVIEEILFLMGYYLVIVFVFNYK